MGEEENLPSAEEMRARYADLMKDEPPAADEGTGDSAQGTEPEPEAESPATSPPPPDKKARSKIWTPPGT